MFRDHGLYIFSDGGEEMVHLHLLAMWTYIQSNLYIASITVIG
jgi:hypothetical protein